jgi:tRNA(Ile2) C34 agmatinyltransferase TiaS
MEYLQQVIQQVKSLLIDMGLWKMVVFSGFSVVATHLVTRAILPHCPVCNRTMESLHIDYNGELLYLCKKCGKVIGKRYGDKTS